MKHQIITAELLLVITMLTGISKYAGAQNGNLQNIYNHITEEGAPLDVLIHRTYGNKYRVIDIRKENGFVPAKVAGGTMPRYCILKDGVEVTGYVLLFYLINDQGRAEEPVVVRSTDERLNATVLGAVDTWRFAPPSVNGKNVWSTAAQEFEFGKRER